MDIRLRSEIGAVQVAGIVLVTVGAILVSFGKDS